MKNTYIFALLLFMTITQYGCNDILNLNPLDQISDENYWKSADNYKLFANKFYDWTRDFGSAVYDGPHSDTRSDVITSSTANIYSNGTNTILSTDANYTNAYKKIRVVNTLLDKANSYGKPDEIDQYVGEAYFFRAYLYFELLQLYGEVIIMDHLADTDDPLLSAARNSREEVVDFIMNDLNAAIPKLPLRSAISSANEGRVSQGAAQAFLSRVALYEGTWQKFRDNGTRAVAMLDTAARVALKVMNSSEYGLFEPSALGDSAYKYLFILENVKSNPAGLKKVANNEYIFATRHDETIDPIGLNITHNCFANVQYVSRKLANMYLCTDGLPIGKSSVFLNYDKMVSEFQNRDNRMWNTLMKGHKAYWRETNPRVTWLGDATDLASAVYTSFIPTFNSGYHNQKWCAERSVASKSEGYDFPIIRYAEVLLNYAEAVFERDGIISDDDLDISLNLVRRRINKSMPKLSNAFVSANGLDMRTEIRRERTVEFFNEGFRIDDLKRWKTAETEMPQDILGVKWTGTEFQTLWSGATKSKNADGCLIMETGRYWEDKNYLYPLPTDQKALNPNLGQNPGW